MFKKLNKVFVRGFLRDTSERIDSIRFKIV